MPTFEVRVNGKKVCTAGLPGDGVLGAHVSSVRRKGSRKPDQLSLHVGGLDSGTGEHVVWHEALPLQLGDKVQVRVSMDGRTDSPSRCEKPDALADLRARKSYVRKLAKELGWKLLIPK
jgi:hypothetical protein